MAENLGSAVLQLTADDRALLKAIGSSKAAASSMANHFKSVASLIGGALGAAGIGLSLRQVFNATVEAETAYRLLEGTVRATGTAAGYTAEQLRAQSAALQEATTFGDEAIQNTQRAIMSFRNIHGEVFRRTTQLVLDFATATGRDAATAARTLGMAINDPENGLSRLRQAGVAVTDQLREQVEQQILAGDLQKAQTLILDELSKSYGGTAAAARDTLGGALTSLQNRFGDLFLEQQAAGNQLREFIQLVEKSLPAVSATFSAVFAAVKTVVEGVVESLFFLGQGIMRLVNREFKAAIESFGQVKGAVTIASDAVRNAKAAYDETANGIRSMDQANRKLAASAPVTAGIVAQASAQMQASLQRSGSVERDLKNLREEMRRERLSQIRDEVQATIEKQKTELSAAEATRKQNIQLSKSYATTFGGLLAASIRAKTGIEGFVKSVIQQIPIAIAQFIALKAATTFLGGIGGGLLGGFLGGFGGARAEGGPTLPGRTYLVGERGPELLTMGSSPGFVTPMSGGGMSVHIENHVSGADFASDGTLTRIFRGMTTAARQGVSEALDAAGAFQDAAGLNPRRAVG